MAGSADVVIDLSTETGFAQIRRSGRSELYVQKSNIFFLELAGVSGETPIEILEINLDGAQE